MNREETIRDIIDAFFKGEDHFEANIGFVWVAKHGLKEINFGDIANVPEDLVLPSAIERSKKDRNKYLYSEFETLTIEPKEGGQYEVAVRIWSEDKWRGYKISDVSDLHSFYLVGANTRGH